MDLQALRQEVERKYHEAIAAIDTIEAFVGAPQFVPCEQCGAKLPENGKCECEPEEQLPPTPAEKIRRRHVQTGNPRGGRVDGQPTNADRAFEFLTACGKPSTGAEICRQTGIPSGSMSVTFANKRFVRLESGLFWLAGEPLPSGEPDDTIEVEFSADDLKVAADESTRCECGAQMFPGSKKCRECYENENPDRKPHRATGNPTGRPRIDRSEDIRKILTDRGGPAGATDIARALNLRRPPVIDQLERGPFVQMDDGRWWLEGVEVPDEPEPTNEEQHVAATKTHGQKVSATDQDPGMPAHKRAAVEIGDRG